MNKMGQDDFDWIRDVNSYLGDYIIKRVGGRHTYVTITDEYMHGPNQQFAVKYYTGDKLPVLSLNMNHGTMLVSTLEDKLDSGSWEKLGTYTEPRTIHESRDDDFEWIREVPSEYSFTIDELYGKKIYYRDNNLRIIRQTKTLSEIKRKDISFRDIRWSNYFTLEGVDVDNNALLRLSDGGGTDRGSSDGLCRHSAAVCS